MGETPRQRAEALAAAERLRRRADYQTCYRKGKRRHGSLTVFYTTPNQLGHPRLGITASRKVGRAVIRVRTKRRIREIYRRWSDRKRLPPVDLVVHVKPGAGEASFDELRAEVERLLRQTMRGASPAS